jgi:uncharacterized protein (DUF924 family)
MAPAEHRIPAPDDVLSFWFADSLADFTALASHERRWFGRDPTLDREILARFGSTIDRAAAGGLDGWAGSARGRLALIILMDQLTRNAFRGSAGAFALDRRAAQLCRDGVGAGADRELVPIERLFFYLPLLHSERLEDQEYSIACFRHLAADAKGSQARYFRTWLRLAHRHRRVVALFGRFPHRNAILGRRTTLPERMFLLYHRVRADIVRRVSCLGDCWLRS